MKKVSAIAIFLLELVKISVIAGLTILFVRYFLFKPFYVEGASMQPNFKEHEYLIIDELTYRLRQPARGETVVFKYPLNTNVYYLKRIIGLPGDRVKIQNNKVVIYNKQNLDGLELGETFLNGVETRGDVNVTLGDGEYFMMGDNRENSYDSRRFGPVKRNLIVGRVVVRGWPVERFGVIKAEPLN